MQMLMERSILFHYIFNIIVKQMLNKCPTKMLKNVYTCLGFVKTYWEHY